VRDGHRVLVVRRGVRRTHAGVHRRRKPVVPRAEIGAESVARIQGEIGRADAPPHALPGARGEVRPPETLREPYPVVVIVRAEIGLEPRPPVEAHPPESREASPPQGHGEVPRNAARAALRAYERLAEHARRVKLALPVPPRRERHVRQKLLVGIAGQEPVEPRHRPRKIGRVAPFRPLP